MDKVTGPILAFFAGSMAWQLAEGRWGSAAIYGTGIYIVAVYAWLGRRRR